MKAEVAALMECLRKYGTSEGASAGHAVQGHAGGAGGDSEWRSALSVKASSFKESAHKRVDGIVKQLTGPKPADGYKALDSVVADAEKTVDDIVREVREKGTKGKPLPSGRYKPGEDSDKPIAGSSLKDTLRRHAGEMKRASSRGQKEARAADFKNAISRIQTLASAPPPGPTWDFRMGKSSRATSGLYVRAHSATPSLAFRLRAFGHGSGDKRLVSARVTGLETAAAPSPDDVEGGTVQAVPLERIAVGRHALVRGRINAAETTMKGGVKADGDGIEPITVAERADKPGHYVVVKGRGEHRIAALKAGGHKGDVPVMVRTVKVLAKYDPDQPRDEAGRFGGGAGGETSQDNKGYTQAASHANSKSKIADASSEAAYRTNTKEAHEASATAHSEAAKAQDVAAVMADKEPVTVIGAHTSGTRVSQHETRDEAFDEMQARGPDHLVRRNRDNGRWEVFATPPVKESGPVLAYQHRNKASRHREHANNESRKARMLDPNWKPFTKGGIPVRVVTRKTLAKFDPDQPRDEDGKFGEGGGPGSATSEHIANARGKLERETDPIRPKAMLGDAVVFVADDGSVKTGALSFSVREAPSGLKPKQRREWKNEHGRNEVRLPDGTRIEVDRKNIRMPKGGFRAKEFTEADKIRKAGMTKGQDMNALALLKAAANLPLSDATSWDADAAEMRVRKWAGGGEDASKTDWARYGKAFLWSAKNPEKLADFKLPFADIEGGKLVANRRGLFAARGALAGARGGVDLPVGEKDEIEGMVAAYLARFDELLGKADDDGDWITVNGRHMLIGEGESVEQAMNRATGGAIDAGDADKTKGAIKSEKGKAGRARDAAGHFIAKAKAAAGPEGRAAAGKADAAHAAAAKAVDAIPFAELADSDAPASLASRFEAKAKSGLDKVAAFRDAVKDLIGVVKNLPQAIVDGLKASADSWQGSLKRVVDHAGTLAAGKTPAKKTDLDKADHAQHVADVLAMMDEADMSAADMADETGMEEERVKAILAGDEEPTDAEMKAMRACCEDLEEEPVEKAAGPKGSMRMVAGIMESKGIEPNDLAGAAKMDEARMADLMAGKDEPTDAEIKAMMRASADMDEDDDSVPARKSDDGQTIYTATRSGERTFDLATLNGEADALAESLLKADAIESADVTDDGVRFTLAKAVEVVSDRIEIMVKGAQPGHEFYGNQWGGGGGGGGESGTQQASEKPNPKELSSRLSAISKTYHDAIPVKNILDHASENGFEAVDDDGTKWSGILTGRDGRAKIDLKEKQSGKVNNGIALQWHKMESGRYEVNAYMTGKVRKSSLFKCSATIADLSGDPVLMEKAAKKGLLYTVVYPNFKDDEEDTQGEVTTPELLEESCHDFALRGEGFNYHHSGALTKDRWVENYIAPCDFQLGKTAVYTGDWVQCIKLCPATRKRFEAGEFGGVSVEGDKVFLD